MERDKKIIDLGILSEDEATGVKRVSIVEEPAILLDFRYFNKQYSFVKPSAGESQDEFISRCIPVLINEGKPEDQAAAVCYSYWEEKMEIDTAGLSPYVDPYIKKKNGKAEAPITKAILASSEEVIDYEWTKDAYVVESILALAKEIGIREEDLADYFRKECFADASAGGSGTSTSEVLNQGDKKLYLYKYTGPITSNSRDFCVGMISLADQGIYYTKAQIQAMSSLAMNPGFGHNGEQYSIWSFKGGSFCRHRWVQYLVTMPNGQIEIEVVKDAAGRAGKTPMSMPKNGRYSAAFKFASEDQQILVGPCMIPDISIPRIDDEGEKYFVKFSAETIKEICMKYFKEARTNDVNTDHEENSAGAYIYESWIVEDPLTDKANTVYGYDLPAGSWVVTMKVDDKETWARIKAGELRGFSIEGILADMEELEAKRKYEKIKKILG